MHSQRLLLPPIHDCHFGERHVSDDYEQRHATHDDENEQHEEEGERRIPPSLGNDFIEPRADLAKPLANRGKLLFARTDPFRQCGREDMPSIYHDDSKHGDSECAYAHA